MYLGSEVSYPFEYAWYFQGEASFNNNHNWCYRNFCWTASPSRTSIHDIFDYKNDNTYKELIGLSTSGAVTFISDLYCGSISDKQLTRRCSLLDLPKQGDSVMADRGRFIIKEDLELLWIQLNLPPCLRGKQQLDNVDLIQTRCIASLRITVERAIQQLKN